jgi:methyl-accepting chemotaxis protein
MYSVTKENDLGENLVSGDLKNSGLGEVWRKIKDTGEICMTDMALYAPSGNKPVMFVGGPLKDLNGEMIGVLVFQIKEDNMNKVMQERSGMGESGETYLVGPDKLMRSDSFLDPVNHSVRISIPGTVEENGVNTDASREALAGQKGSGVIIDYNGNPVLSCYSSIVLPGSGIRWAVIAEIDEAEVMKSVKELRNIALRAALILALFIGVFALWMALSISGPIEQITGIAKEVADGKLDSNVEIQREDEIGYLANAMSGMIKILKNMNSEVVNQSQQILKGDFHARTNISHFSGEYRLLMEGINDITNQFASQTGDSITIINQSLQDLSVSSKEISTTSNQQAVAVKEIVSTMEDSEKLAKGVAVKIDEVVKISKKTEEDVDKGFSIIKSSLEQMSQINTTNDCSIAGVKLLGQQIESIWEIVGMINSIADQTKIIAFNAELEASKTGESGKNFEIVAGEIRRLADNTVSSTKDIKSKIDEIQKSSDNLILASEEGTEKIKAGLKLSKDLEVIFSEILSSSEISASSAEQIALSINQQASSFEQILLALKQISGGIDNFVASTASTTQAINGLETMLQSLNNKLDNPPETK